MKRRELHAAILITALSVLASASCSKKAAQWKGRIEIDAGIPVVHNPNEPISSRDALTLTSDLAIGQESDGPQAVVFRNLLPYGCVDTDAAGNIYVLDSGADTVFKFDTRGSLLKSFGRQGQGPGEFQSATCLKIMPDGRIVIVDDMARKRLAFSLDGTPLMEESLAHFPELMRSALDHEGGIIAMTWESGSRLMQGLIRILPSLKEMVKLAEYETRRIFDGATLDLYIPQFEFAVSMSGYIVWGFQRKYLLNISRLDGKVIRKIEKDYGPTPITESAFQARLKEVFAGRTVPPSIEPVHPPSYWPFYLIIADEKGRILARTPEKSADGNMKYDVFDVEGRFLSKIELTGPPVLWKGGCLFVVEENPETEQILRRFRVEWEFD